MCGTRVRILSNHHLQRCSLTTMIGQRIHVTGFPKQLARAVIGRRRRLKVFGAGGGEVGGGQYYDRRWLTAGPVVAADAPTVPIRFVKSDGSSMVVDAREGESLLQTAHRFDIGLEGACEGVCACSTCHLIFPQKLYNSLPEPSENEDDMLDMAYGLTETSRLGCQVIVNKAMANVDLELPKATRNFYVDGHVPKPH